MKRSHIHAVILCLLACFCVSRHEEKFEIYLDGQRVGQFGWSSLKGIKSIPMHISEGGKTVDAYPLIEVLRMKGIDFAKYVRVENAEGNSLTMGWSTIEHGGFKVSLYRIRKGGFFLAASDPKWQREFEKLTKIAKISVFKSIKKHDDAGSQKNMLKIFVNNILKRTVSFGEIEDELEGTHITTQSGSAVAYPLDEVLWLAGVTKGKRIEVRAADGRIEVVDWDQAKSSLLQSNRRGVIKLTKQQTKSISYGDQGYERRAKGKRKHRQDKKPHFKGIKELYVSD